VTKGEFGSARSCRIVAEVYWPRHQPFYLGLNIVTSPGFLHFVGRANFVLPAPHFERSCYTKPADSFRLLLVQKLNDLGDSRTYKSFELIRGRISVILTQYTSDLPDKVHQDEIRAASPELKADRESALWIERHRHGRLADLAANWRPLDQQ